jgi:hypothetical protein
VVSRNYLYAAQAVILNAAKNLAAAIFAAVMVFHRKPLENHAAQDAA